MGLIEVVTPQDFPAAILTEGKGKKERMQWYRPEPEAPLRLSRVSINFPMLVRYDHESEQEGRETALNAWYGFCDLGQIAEKCGGVVQRVRTIKPPEGADSRRNTTGDHILDTGTQTHVFRITWENLFTTIFSGLESSTFQGYSLVTEENKTQNIKLALCHPHYESLGTPIAMEVLSQAVRHAKQSDGSVRDLMSAPILALLWINPTSQSSDQPRDGSSRAYRNDQWIANLVIMPDIPGHNPLVINRASLYVSHEVVDGIKEVFIREFDSRRV